MTVTEHTFDLAGISVMLAMPAHSNIPVQTAMSLLATQSMLHARGIDNEFSFTVGGDTVVTARSKAVHTFLKSRCNRLFFVDSDMSWQAADFLRLLCLSTKMECVGAIYTVRADPPNFFINVNKDVAAGGAMYPNEYGCLPIDGMGLGFTCVQRVVMEKLAAKAPKLKFPLYDDLIANMFHCADGEDGSEFVGEDMLFFRDVKNLGYQVWLDPNITLGHIGQKTFTADPMTFLQPHSVLPAQSSAAA